MAKEKVQKKARDKWREKVWFTIMAPDFLGGKEIAMSPAEDGEAMVSRKVEVPISDLTGNFKRANAKAIFQVTGCQGSKCSTQFIGHYLSDDYIRRMVRRRKERIDIIRDYTTSDGSVVTFKVVIVTDGKLTNTKRLQIRHTVDGMLESKIRGGMGFQDTVRYIIGEDIYNDIIESTKDIYPPIKKVELRKTEVKGQSVQPAQGEQQQEVETEAPAGS